MRSQWECFLQNLGVWSGSFTKFSPLGEQLNDIPSRLTLTGLNNNKEARLVLERDGQSDFVSEFSTLSRSILFFENGAFCQGTIQLAPFSESGAEFSLIHGNRRLRLVQFLDTNGVLSSITLIREHAAGTEPNERPPLTVDALLGEWEGEAVTLYPDLRSPTSIRTNMKLTLDDSGRLKQSLIFADRSISSQATIQGSVLNFEQNQVQVLLLPDGASATFPAKIQFGKPMFLEIGWLIKPNLRQRLIRSYSNKGEWVGVTLATEKRVG